MTQTSTSLTFEEQAALDEFNAVPSYIERFKTNEEYQVVGMIVVGAPVIFYDDDDTPIHNGIDPCGKAGCPCMAG